MMAYPLNGNFGSDVGEGVGAKVPVGEAVEVDGTGVEVGLLVGLGVIDCGVGTVPQATSRIIREIQEKRFDIASILFITILH